MRSWVGTAAALSAVALTLALGADSEDSAGARTNRILTLAYAAPATLAGALGPDAFEPDDDRAQAVPIGRRRPGASNPGVDGQSHTVEPAGDEDWVRLRLDADSLVTIRTRCTEDCPDPTAVDTIVELYRAGASTSFGLCNQSFTGVPGQISTAIGNACTGDLDCDTDGDGLVFPDDPDDLVDPVTGLPACLSWELFDPLLRPVDPVDNALATNDDAAPGDRTSALTLCLPRTKPGGKGGNAGPAGDDEEDDEDPDDEQDDDEDEDGASAGAGWYVRTGGFAGTGDPADSTLEFAYEIAVENTAACRFEQEPNDELPLRKPVRVDDLPLPGSIHGIWSLSDHEPEPDVDLYRFDVTEPTEILFEIRGYDPLRVDTYIELWVGPDAAGQYQATGHSNDDRGPLDFRSRLQVELPPACEWLGNCGAKGRGNRPPPAYYLSVSSNFVQPDFPYELRSSVLGDAAP